MNINELKKSISSNRKLSDVLFIFWAGGAALLSYSLVYALRKPFTAATFDGLDFFGMDYKTVTSIVQIFGYFLSKLIGIKVISELKKENRLRFIILSVAVAELSLVLFGLLPRPFNVFALFFNGLSLGCMWGVIFSFLEGRRVTDLLASLMGLSIAISSGTAKSIGLFVMENLHILSFQTLFFERFIACFRIRGNVGFFIITLDFIGYMGTVLVLVLKECFKPNIDWLHFYNLMSGYVGVTCAMAFMGALVYLLARYRRERTVCVGKNRLFITQNCFGLSPKIANTQQVK